MFSHSHVLLSSLLALVTCVTAQTGIVYPTTASSGAIAVPTGYGYKYVGCYNETTDVANSGGVHALQGNTTANNVMTVDDCLQFCGHTQYAGLEYGRECYCGPLLSSLSTKLDDSRCNFACNGNASEICGGSLALSVYNLTKTSSAVGSSLSSTGGAMGYGTAAVIGLLIAAVL